MTLHHRRPLAASILFLLFAGSSTVSCKERCQPAPLEDRLAKYPTAALDALQAVATGGEVCSRGGGGAEIVLSGSYASAATKLDDAFRARGWGQSKRTHQGKRVSMSFTPNDATPKGAYVDLVVEGEHCRWGNVCVQMLTYAPGAP